MEINHLLPAVLTDTEGNKDRAFERASPCLSFYDDPVQDESPEGRNDASSMKSPDRIIQSLCRPGHGLGTDPLFREETEERCRPFALISPKGSS